MSQLYVMEDEKSIIVNYKFFLYGEWLYHWEKKPPTITDPQNPEKMFPKMDTGNSILLKFNLN